MKKALQKITLQENIFAIIKVVIRLLFIICLFIGPN